jgi:phosphatidylserine/phosphatidylglycerophosphate/cardiolipin synthase-like enzyme
MEVSMTAAMSNTHRVTVHDKYMVIDGKDVETGSLNYSGAAATKNSENALVLWNYPLMAEPYLNHWQSRWRQASYFHSTY